MDQQQPTTIEFRAMGSQIAIWLYCDDPAAAEHALSEAQTLFVTSEARLTRFRPTSELSLLNSRPDRWVRVSDPLWTMIDRALALAAATGGLFNPALLNALEQAGYDRSFDLLGNDARRTTAATPATLPGTVDRDFEKRAVWLPTGTRLDLGGIAKGMTAQFVVDLLRAWGPALVDAGGDLVAGDAPPGMTGWPVAVAAPAAADQTADDLFRLWLRNATLATSGVDYRRWVVAGRPAHHIIDPRSGFPTDSDAVTVSVLAADAATAEGWSTAGLVLGIRDGLAALTERGLAAAVVDRNGRLWLTPAMQTLAQF